MLSTGQDLGQRFTNFRLVIDDQNRVLSRTRLHRRAGIGMRNLYGTNRQRDRERGAALARTFDGERAVVGFDDAKTHRQSNAGADTGGLGREIGLEYPRTKMPGCVSSPSKKLMKGRPAASAVS